MRETSCPSRTKIENHLRTLISGGELEEALEVSLALQSHGSSSMRSSAARVPVVGFALDGIFVLADSPVRCTKGEVKDDPSCSGGGDLGHQVKAGTS